MKLPKKLGKEPLVEALFDMRFQAKAPASTILPGLVFTKFPGQKIIERLQSAEVPEPVLARLDPNYRYAPDVRIHWENFLILSGKQSFGLACKLPYPGWTAGFKPAILRLAELVGEAGFVNLVERFSLKYTNIIPSALGNAPTVVNVILKVGEHDGAQSSFQIRTEIRKNSNIISIVQLAAEGVVKFPDRTTRKGVPFDIDTITMIENVPFPTFMSDLSDRLEATHTEAKTIFFSCLKPEALTKLEPVYE